LGGGNWDGWFGPTGRDVNTTKEQMIQLILASKSATALANAGYPLNSQHISLMLENSEISCDNNDKQQICDPYNGPCLFNLEEDPCERNNLATQYPDILEELLNFLNQQNATALEPIPRFKDPRGLPENFNHIWTNWKDYIVN